MGLFALFPLCPLFPLWALCSSCGLSVPAVCSLFQVCALSPGSKSPFTQPLWTFLLLHLVFTELFDFTSQNPFTPPLSATTFLGIYHLEAGRGFVLVILSYATTSYLCQIKLDHILLL